MTQTRIPNLSPAVAAEISVEFAHVYADEQLGAEQDLSAVEAARISAEHDDVQRVVLVDDYNAVVAPQRLGALLAELRELAPPEDVIASEAALAPAAQMLLRSMAAGRERRSIERYVRDRRRWPCSLLTAAWYLVRLGELPAPERLFLTSDPLRPAAELVNLLPARFGESERRAMALLGASSFAACASRIHTRLLPAPAVAVLAEN
jgi:hypothetical protein